LNLSVPVAVLFFSNHNNNAGARMGSFLIARAPLVLSTASGDDYYSREFIHRVFAIVKEAIFAGCY